MAKSRLTSAGRAFPAGHGDGNGGRALAGPGVARGLVGDGGAAALNAALRRAEALVRAGDPGCAYTRAFLPGTAAARR
jgi:hypothetical protein